jgi:hypothetical protein
MPEKTEIIFKTWGYNTKSQIKKNKMSSIKKTKEVYKIKEKYINTLNEERFVEIDLTVNFENKSFSINRDESFDRYQFIFHNSSRRGSAVIRAMQKAIDKWKELIDNQNSNE